MPKSESSVFQKAIPACAGPSRSAVWISCLLVLVWAIGSFYLRLTIPGFGVRGVTISSVLTIVLAALYGGWFAGIFATLLGSGTLYFLLLRIEVNFSQADRFYLTLLLLLFGGLISVLIEQMHRVQAKLRLREKELERLVSEKTRELDLTSSSLEHESQAKAAVRKALWESERLYRGTFENAAMGIAHATIEGKWVLVNDALCRMVGYTREELLELSFQGITHPEDMGKSTAQVPRLLSGEISAFSIQKRYLHRNGATIWVNVTVSLLRDENGQPLHTVTIVDDVTERVRMEKNLRLSQRQMAFFFENTPAAMAVFDRQMRYLQVSRRWLQDYGLEGRQILGHSYYEVFSDVPEKLREIHQHCLNGKTHRGEEELFRRPDGSELWLQWEILPWYESDEEVGGLIVVTLDITPRKRLEMALRHSAELARAEWAQAEAALEAVPAHIVILGQLGEIVRVNKAWAAFVKPLGLGAEELGVGHNYLELCERLAAVHGEIGAFATGIRGVLDGQQPRFSMEYSSAAEQGVRWWMGYVVAIAGTGPARALIAYVDISDQKRIQQQIEQLNAELEKRVVDRTWQLESAVSELQEQIGERQRLEYEVLGISGREQSRLGQELHDNLGQQLAAIRIFTQLLQKTLENDEHPGATDCQQIAHFIGEALNTTRSLSKSFYPVELERGGLVLTLKDLAERTEAQTKVRCKARFDDEFSVSEEAAIHLYRMVQESISNALKHANPTEILIEGHAEGSQMRLSVTDNGSGFVEPQKGQGLGLRLFQYRARLIQAKVTVKRLNEQGGCRVECVFQNPQPANHW